MMACSNDTQGGVQGLGDEGREDTVFDKAVDDVIKRRAGGAGGLGGLWREDVRDDSEGCGTRTCFERRCVADG